MSLGALLFFTIPPHTRRNSCVSDQFFFPAFSLSLDSDRFFVAGPAADFFSFWISSKL